MGNGKRFGGAEVKIGVGLIGALLLILTVVVVHRNNRRPATVDAPVGATTLSGGGEVIPAEFHAKAPAPTVLKPRASLPPPSYADQTAPSEPRGRFASRPPAAEALPMTGDASVPRNFMPKLPVTPSPEAPAAASPEAPAATPRPATGAAPRYTRDVIPPRNPTQAFDPEPPIEPERRSAAQAPVAMAPTVPEDLQDLGATPRPAEAHTAESTEMPSIATMPPRAAMSANTQRAERPPQAAATAVLPPGPAVATANTKETPPRESSHTTRSGESMWSISKQVYGTGAFFRALVEYNRDQIPTPERLAIGVQVATPTEDALRATYPNLCPRPHKGPATRRQAAPVGDLAVPTGGRKYLAEEGDTLSVIARYELGDVNRWSEIYQLNHALLGDDPNSLRPGTWLVLPAAASRDSLVRRPNPPAGQ